MKKFLVCFLVMLGSLLLFFPSYSLAKPKSPPDFTLKSNQGSNIRLSEQRGRWVILYFWASWCSVCRDDLIQLQNFQSQMNYPGLKVLGVNLGQKSVGDYARSAKLSFPLLLDPKSTTAALFGVDEVPTMVLVDRDGQVNFRSKRLAAARLNELAEAIRSAPDYR